MFRMAVIGLWFMTIPISGCLLLVPNNDPPELLQAGEVRPIVANRVATGVALAFMLRNSERQSMHPPYSLLAALETGVIAGVGLPVDDGAFYKRSSVEKCGQIAMARSLAISYLILDLYPQCSKSSSCPEKSIELTAGNNSTEPCQLERVYLGVHTRSEYF